MALQIDVFKNLVQELTDYERTVIIPILIDALRYRTVERMVTSKQLSVHLKQCGYNVGPERVRKILAYTSAANIKKGFNEDLGR